MEVIQICNTQCRCMIKKMINFQLLRLIQQHITSRQDFNRDKNTHSAYWQVISLGTALSLQVSRSKQLMYLILHLSLQEMKIIQRNTKLPFPGILLLTTVALQSSTTKLRYIKKVKMLSQKEENQQITQSSGQI